MATSESTAPKDALHRLIDGLDDDEAARLPRALGHPSRGTPALALEDDGPEPDTVSLDTLSVTRPELHALVDTLPDTELTEAKRYLTGLSTFDDPPLRNALLAPIDDEPLTEEEIAAVEEAKREMERGEHVTMDDMKRELGLA